MDPALSALVGHWTVKFKKWTWDYTFSADGRVSWRDPNNGQTGSGRVGKAPKVIFFTWDGSSTKETWNLPVSGSMTGWVQASYGTGLLTAARKAGAAPPAPAPGPSDATLLATAFEASRASLRAALGRLRALELRVTSAARANGLAKINELTQLQLQFERDIAVLVRRLLVPNDPTSPAFRAALTRAIQLIEGNLALPNTIRVTRNTGMCANPSFAWTHIGVRPPDTELCTAWVNAAPDLRRDVITHEYFHTLGLDDISVNSTADAFRNANTLAQVVAFIADRGRQVNSDGHEPAVPPLPSP